jgi:hypothetical protein
MPITNKAVWRKYVESNEAPYGKCCVDVAREAMRILDKEPGEIDPYSLITKADDNIQAGGITGFMAGCVANIISQCHSRGEEFKEKWNLRYDNKPRNGVINPVVLITKREEPTP